MIANLRCGLALLLACACTLASGDAVAAPPTLTVPVEVNEAQRFYAVDAVQLDVLSEQIDRGRPLASNGRRSHGLLALDLGLHYQLQPQAGRCELQRPRVRLEMQLWLPDWQPEGEAPAALREAWAAMLAGLIEHEAGHRDMAVAAARELAARVAVLGARSDLDCPTLRRELLGARLSQLSRLAVRSAAYDRRTAHGQRQGAVLALEAVGLDPCTLRDSALYLRCRGRP